MLRENRRPVLFAECLEERTVLSFFAPLSYPVGDAPVAVLAADLNFDGALDLVTANDASGTVSVVLGNGDGLFRAAQHFAVGRGVNSVATADFNADGVPDLAAAVEPARTVAVLYGNGDGSFQPAVSFAAGQSPRSVVAGDVDGDGSVDLVVLNPTAGTASLLLNRGDGTFDPPQALNVGGSAHAAVATDFNRDGLTDLAITLPDRHAVAVLLGNGGGSFQMLAGQPAGRFPTAATVADFNADGVTDLAAATIDGATVLLGNGDGTFVRRDAGFEGRYYVTAVAAGDFNADGVFDLALGGADADKRAIYGGLSIQLGNGDGTFRRIEIEDSTVFAADLTAGDFNGDGMTDLAAASYLRVCDDECSVFANSLLVLHGAGGGDWRRAPIVNGGRSPNSVAAGDFNGDGIADLVTASFNGVGLLLGNGDGSFVPQQFVLLARTPFSLAAGDFNGDGRLDVAAAVPATFPTLTNGELNVLLGNGDGTWQPVRVFATNSYPADVAAGDVNADGVLDLFTVNAGVRVQDPASVTVFLGSGDGSFKPAANYETGRGGWGAAAVADLNFDGYADAAVAITGTAPGSGLYVLLSNGDGTFQEPIHYPFGVAVQAVLTGDFNGDGVLDLAAGLGLGVSVLLGNGDGSFQPALLTPLPRGANALALGDFNADGLLDLAATTLSGNAVTVLRGNGDGTFRDPLPYAVRQAPRDVTVADFNGDGWADLAAASNGTWPSYADGGISLLFNDGYWPAAPFGGGAPGAGDVIAAFSKKR